MSIISIIKAFFRSKELEKLRQWNQYIQELKK